MVYVLIDGTACYHNQPLSSSLAVVKKLQIPQELKINFIFWKYATLVNDTDSKIYGQNRPISYFINQKKLILLYFF